MTCSTHRWLEERDPQVLAEFARGRMRSRIDQLRDALQGRFSEHHALVIAHVLARIDHADATIDALSERIGQVVAPFARQVECQRTRPVES